MDAGKPNTRDRSLDKSADHLHETAKSTDWDCFRLEIKLGFPR